MYQEMKDLRKAIQRQHECAAAGANVSQGERNAYYRGQMNAFYQVLAFIDAALDEYENSDQPTPHDLDVSDFADYVSFAKQCQ